MSALEQPAVGAPLPRIHKEHGFLSPDENKALVLYAIEHEARFSPTTVMSQGAEASNAGHRSSRKLVPLPGDRKSALRSHFAEAFPRAAEVTGVNVRKYNRIELEIVAHNNGDHFGRHIDTLYYGANTERKSFRFLSAVYYFFQEPRQFSGGELVIYPFGNSISDTRKIELVPENNMAVFFPSFAAHEVLPVACHSAAFGDSRFAVNCWFHSDLS